MFMFGKQVENKEYLKLEIRKNKNIYHFDNTFKNSTNSSKMTLN